jgi:hypothetical protein
MNGIRTAMRGLAAFALITFVVVSAPPANADDPGIQDPLGICNLSDPTTGVLSGSCHLDAGVVEFRCSGTVFDVTPPSITLGQGRCEFLKVSAGATSAVFSCSGEGLLSVNAALPFSFSLDFGQGRCAGAITTPAGTTSGSCTGGILEVSTDPLRAEIFKAQCTLELTDDVAIDCGGAALVVDVTATPPIRTTFGCDT